MSKLQTTSDEIENTQKRDRALVFLGGIRVADRIAQALSAESMRSLIKFQEDKEYEILGFENFVEFLNESEHAPMTKSQFYERKTVLEKEGDVAFDLLNSLGMPVSKRKLLGRGNIQLDGQNIIVVDPDTNEEMTFAADDKTRILETITALADANAHKSIKIERERKETTRLRGVVGDLQKLIDTERAAAKTGELDAHSLALLNLINAFQTLKTETENLTLVEKEQFAPRTFETIARQLDALSVAYNRISTLSDRADHLAHDTEAPTDRQIRLHKDAVKDADVRESKKNLRAVERVRAEEMTANDDELADLMD